MTRIARFATIAAVWLSFMSPSHATVITYQTSLSGLAEAPPNASPATGFANIVYDSIAQTLSISAEWTGLQGTTTAAHIHCCTLPPNNVGVAVTPGTLPGFPVGVNAEIYNSVINLAVSDSYTTAFFTTFGAGTVEGAEAALIAGLNDGRAYFNIHTTAFPGGEIRGFLSAIPEPASLALLSLGLASLGFIRRRQKAPSPAHPPSAMGRSAH
jgi:hypothetical protein